MTHLVSASVVFRRFTMPAGLFGVLTASQFLSDHGLGSREMIGHAHLHPSMGEANAAIRSGGVEASDVADHWAAYADRWGKGHWPIDLQWLEQKAGMLGDVDLDFEIGRSTWNLVDCTADLRRKRRSAIAHFARVRRLLAARGTFARGGYAMRFPEIAGGDWIAELANDRECFSLAGWPARIISGYYGVPSLARIEDWRRD